jgi:hypothetical protein
MPIYTSKDFRIHLQVAGVTYDTVSWDKFTGGNVVGENQQYNPGGAMPQVVVGGLRKRGPATLERAWDDSLIGAYLAFDAAVTFASVTCSITPLKGKAQNGGPFTYTGVLESVTRPDADSNTSNVAMMTAIVTLNDTMS